MKKPVFIWSLLGMALLLVSFTLPMKEKEKDFQIKYEKITLDNGLEVILHEDHSDPIVAVATIMHVGSNREKPGRTGFAHFFEHMSFNDSENAPRGANRKLIPEWGGARNGGTWSDGTIYYEVVPKDAFDKILWIDSDRLGYMINTVTTEALEREKQVVKNEKRERTDNVPYGYTDEVIRKNLYPEGHPYNWTVIGQLPDLQAATLEDVKEFYEKFYGAGNATLVIAGDIDIEDTKKKVERWFGEIRKGPEVQPMTPKPVNLTATKKLYFEDNFAKLPELRMVFPTVEEYNKDVYALNVLGQLLSGSKKSVLYQKIVEEKKLAPSARSYHNANELAGEFVFRVRANAGTDLDDIKAGIEEALKEFEENGFSDNELKRIKAELETGLYSGVSTVLNKAFQLAIDNEFKGDPGYITTTARLTEAVSREDVMRVYNTYIKGKNYVMTSFVPQGKQELAVSGSELAEVYVEEVKQDVDAEEVSQGAEAEYVKTPSKYDRSEPEFGELPLFKSPEIWMSEAANGIKMYGIYYEEVPLVNFTLTFNGGHFTEPIDKAGVANLLTDLMMEGTATKTPAELEEAIGLLGAQINMSSGVEEVRISATCLAKNFEATWALVQEILLEPRWDEQEFSRLKKSLLTGLKGREANPTAIAALAFNGLVYGKNHPFGVSSAGTLKTVETITMDDLKQYYAKNIAPNLADFHIAGYVDQQRAENALKSFDTSWKSVSAPPVSYNISTQDHKNKLYFIDFPGAKQSVIYAGKLALSAKDKESAKLGFANEILGGGSSGRLFQTLRIEKGYTYGAYSGISDRLEVAPFIARSSVRANATLPSLKIFKELIGNYGTDFSDKEVETTKTKVLKASTRAYESLGQKLSILRNISKFNKQPDFIEMEQKELVDMKREDFVSLIEHYLDEEEMLYVVVGDKATQWDLINEFGREVIELDIHGNPVAE